MAFLGVWLGYGDLLITSVSPSKCHSACLRPLELRLSILFLTVVLMITLFFYRSSITICKLVEANHSLDCVEVLGLVFELISGSCAYRLSLLT